LKKELSKDSIVLVNKISLKNTYEAIGHEKIHEIAKSHRWPGKNSYFWAGEVGNFPELNNLWLDNDSIINRVYGISEFGNRKVNISVNPSMYGSSYMLHLYNVLIAKIHLDTFSSIHHIIIIYHPIYNYFGVDNVGSTGISHNSGCITRDIDR
jgi:hypothetical protein